MKANDDLSTATFDTPELLLMREKADNDDDACGNGARASNFRCMFDLNQTGAAIS